MSQSIVFKADDTGWFDVIVRHGKVRVEFVARNNGFRTALISYDAGRNKETIPWPFGQSPTFNEVITTAISTAARAYEEQALTSAQPQTGERT